MTTRKCVICGAEFIPRPANRKVCYNDHHHPCPVCGKDVVCNDPKRQNCTCSRECGSSVGNSSRKTTLLAKYGVDNSSRIPGVSLKISDKLKQIHPAQPKQYKVCEICGTLFELQWPYTQHTCSSTCRGLYRKRSGISKQVYDKSCQTNLKRYGVMNPGERPEVHTKMEDTMEERYGVRYARYLPEIEARVRQTCMSRYGVPYYIQSEEANRNNIYRISQINQKFLAALNAAGIPAVLEKYMNTKFYDISLSNQNILIEIDPTYTHNSIGNHWNSNGLAPDYHLRKSQVALDNGYRCIHVFDWDSWNKIIMLLKKPTRRIYARNCEVRSISKEQSDLFTSTYHIQGRCKGQNVNYGLYLDNELLMVMTFGKPRYAHNYDYELLRLCTVIDVQVVGGASKLFVQFINEHSGASVISYCDRAKFTGRVYEAIGMKLVKITEPNKIWSKDDKKITQNLLNQRGFDQLFGANYGKGTNNEELMLQAGWLPVYDCGQMVFEYRV